MLDDLVMNAPQSEKETKAAEPMANPFPIAAVQLPAASSQSVLYLTSGGQATISAIPPALSETGPQASIANPIDKVDNIPRAAKATPNIDNSENEMNAVIANKKTGIIVDKFPRAKP